jgi:ATPase subunit of ABC transporter with duplicated ATPase domains
LLACGARVAFWRRPPLSQTGCQKNAQPSPPKQKNKKTANLVKQAKSKQKILDKMYEAGLTPDPRVGKERTFAFKFPACQKLPPPVLPFLDVSFGYDGNPEGYLYKVFVWVCRERRLALVGERCSAVSVSSRRLPPHAVTVRTPNPKTHTTHTNNNI